MPINSASKEGLSAVAEWTREYSMEANARNTSYTLLGSDNTAPLAPRLLGRPGRYGSHADSSGRQVTASSWNGTRANRHEELDQRPHQLSTILSFAWESRRDTLRALYIALPRAEATHGVSAWCLDASPTSRCTLDPAK
ncbi:hypothetical protein TcBrA4_0080580 [Trypanosoma cruzi]|nr:hypothetical protein TcBrA4_0080580 [Trypanosoma cruzi]